MSRLSMNKISELLRQRFELKRSYRDIGRGLNISQEFRKRASNYIFTPVRFFDQLANRKSAP